MATIEKTEIGEKIYEFKFKNGVSDLVLTIHKPSREKWLSLITQETCEFTENASPLQEEINYYEIKKTGAIFCICKKYINGNSFEIIFDYKEFEPALRELNLWFLKKKN